MPMNREDQARRSAMVLAKAWAGEAFKSMLTSGPAAVLKAEGIEAPRGVNVAETADLDELTLKERLAADGYQCATNLGTSTGC